MSSDINRRPSSPPGPGPLLVNRDAQGNQVKPKPKVTIEPIDPIGASTAVAAEDIDLANVSEDGLFNPLISAHYAITTNVVKPTVGIDAKKDKNDKEKERDAKDTNKDVWRAPQYRSMRQSKLVNLADAQLAGGNVAADKALQKLLSKAERVEASLRRALERDDELLAELGRLEDELQPGSPGRTLSPDRLRTPPGVMSPERTLSPSRMDPHSPLVSPRNGVVASPPPVFAHKPNPYPSPPLSPRAPTAKS